MTRTRAAVVVDKGVVITEASVFPFTTIYSKSMSSSLTKKHSPSNPALVKGIAPQSQASQQLQFPNKSQSQSHSQSSQQTLQSRPLYPWSAHTPPSGQRPSPFPQYLLAVSTIATASGEWFLFGGLPRDSMRDLYVISTRDFSTTLLQTRGDVPEPRHGHHAVLTSTTLLIWGGRTVSDVHDDSFYLLNLGTSDLFHVKIRPS